MPENNRKQNWEESYTNKYKKRIACCYDYELVCVDDTLSQPFKTYLGKDAIYTSINSMLKESKYCIDVMKKHFKKELVLGKNLW